MALLIILIILINSHELYGKTRVMSSNGDHYWQTVLFNPILVTTRNHHQMQRPNILSRESGGVENVPLMESELSPGVDFVSHY